MSLFFTLCMTCVLIRTLHVHVNLALPDAVPIFTVIIYPDLCFFFFFFFAPDYHGPGGDLDQRTRAGDGPTHTGDDPEIEV